MSAGLIDKPATQGEPESGPRADERTPFLPDRVWPTRMDRWLLLAPLPGVLVFLIELWIRPHYQFFPVYLAICSVLLWAARPRQWGGLTHRASVILLLGSVGVLVGAALWSPYLIAASWLILLAGVLLRGGTEAIPGWGPAWGALWMVIPPPFGLDGLLVQKLRTAMSLGASGLLESLGVLHLRRGNTFEIPGRQFFVEDACSGMNSLLLFIATAVLWAVYRRLSSIHVVALVGFAAITAMALNVLRIVLIVAGAAWWQWDLANGWSHEALGVALFALGQVLIWNGAELVWWERQPWSPDASNPPDILPMEKSVTTVAVSVLMLFAVGLEMVHLRNRFPNSPAAAFTPRLTQVPTVSAGLLPKKWHDWQFMKMEDISRQSWTLGEGTTSHRWAYATPYGHIVASIDYPFINMHRLETCYSSGGWDCRPTISLIGTDDPMRLMELRRTDRRGHLIYGALGDDGALYPPTNPMPAEPTVASLWQRIAGRFQPVVVAAPVSTVQVQLLAVSDNPLMPEERKELERAFLEFRDRVQALWQHEPSSEQPAVRGNQP